MNTEILYFLYLALKIFAWMGVVMCLHIVFDIAFRVS